MIRKLVENTFVPGLLYVRMAGLSTDNKPTGGMITGSHFLEVDTGFVYEYDEVAQEWNKTEALSEEIVEAVNAWLDDHPEATTTVQDGAITYAKLNASLKGTVDDVSDLKSALEKYNCANIFVDGTYTSGTHRDVTFTWSGRVCAVSGKASGGVAQNVIYDKTNVMPDNISAGKTYKARVSITGSNIILQFYEYASGSASPTLIKQITESGVYDIPIAQTSVGMRIRLAVANGNTASGTVSFDVTETLTQSELETITKTNRDNIAALEGELEDIDEQTKDLQNNGSVDYIKLYGRHQNISSTAPHGVGFTWNQAKTECTVTGTIASSANNFIFDDNNTLLPYLKKGSTCIAKCKTTDTDVFLRIIVYVGESYKVYDVTNKENVPIPSDCTNISVALRASNIGHTFNNAVISVQFQNALTNSELLDEIKIVDDKVRKDVSILFIGNSLTATTVSYVPYILTNCFPGIFKFKAYFWFNGGFDIAQQWEKANNDEPAANFYYTEDSEFWNYVHFDDAEAEVGWVAPTLEYVCEHYHFDVVCMQEYFNYKADDEPPYTQTDLDAWNNLQSYIVDHYTGGNPLKFVTLFPVPRPAGDTVAPYNTATEIFEATKTGISTILKETLAEDMIASGIALYRARATSLDSFGDAGHLSSDGTHPQDGLPVVMTGLTVIWWLFNFYGINKSVYGLPFRMTYELFQSIRNKLTWNKVGTDAIGGTDAQNLLGQELVIKACKEAKQFVIQNLSD